MECVCVCVCVVCVRVRACVCVYVCVCERERQMTFKQIRHFAISASLSKKLVQYINCLTLNNVKLKII
jgi:hypothetical protein